MPARSRLKSAGTSRPPENRPGLPDRTIGLATRVRRVAQRLSERAQERRIERVDGRPRQAQLADGPVLDRLDHDRRLRAFGDRRFPPLARALDGRFAFGRAFGARALAFAGLGFFFPALAFSVGLAALAFFGPALATSLTAGLGGCLRTPFGLARRPRRSSP